MKEPGVQRVRISGVAKSEFARDPVVDECLVPIAEFVARRTRSGASEELDLRDDDLVEWEEDGVRQWRSVRVLSESALRFDGVVDLILPSAKRGVEGNVRVLRAKDGEPTSLDSVENRSEDELVSWAGRSRTRTAKRDARALVLVHGFASTGDLSFAPWKDPRALNQLSARYRGGVWSFEHRTVRASPVENAAGLLRAISRRFDGIEQVDLLGYSRGGMVAELAAGLTVQDRSDTERYMSVPAYATAWQSLSRQLSELDRAEQARESRAKIRRVFRVASPIAGTPLAGPLVHTGLSLLLDAVASLLSSSPAVKVTTSLLLGLLRLLTTDELLTVRTPTPGLAAMNPEGALVRWLACTQAASSWQRVAISGTWFDDGRGGVRSHVAKLAQWATQKLFGDHNDLVVPERSMLAGASPRERTMLARSVTHFSFFDRPAESEDNEVLRALTADATEQDAATGTRATRVARATPSASEKPIALVIPGIMGSHLALAKPQRRIWLHALRLMFGQFSELDLNKKHTIHADGWIDNFYHPLEVELGKLGYEVLRGDFDWRLPIAQSARDLVRRLVPTLNGGSRPWVVVAHSMGGVVGSEVLQQLFDSHRRMFDALKRVVFLGVPHRGSQSAQNALDGSEDLVRLLSAVDLRNCKDEVVRVINSFVGLKELVPGCDPSRLDKLREHFLRRNGRHPSIVTVLGSAPSTPRAPNDPPATPGVVDGDERVLHTSSRLRLSEGDPFDNEHVVQVRARHGDLPRARKFLLALEQLLDAPEDGAQMLPAEASSEPSSLFTWRDGAPGATASLPVLDEEDAFERAIFGSEPEKYSVRAAREEMMLERQRVASKTTLASSSQSALAPASSSLDKKVSVRVVHGAIRSVLLNARSTGSSAHHDKERLPPQAIVVGAFSRTQPSQLLLDLDESLGGQINVAFRAGQMLATRGEIQAFRSMNSRVTVVLYGVGREQDWSRDGLGNPLVAALVRAALDVETSRPRRNKLHLATALPSGLPELDEVSIGSAVAEMLDSVVLANRELERRASAVRVETLTVYEQYRDTAIAVTRATLLHERSSRIEREPGELVEVTQRLASGEGYHGWRPIRLAAMPEVTSIRVQSRERDAQEVRLAFSPDTGAAAIHADTRALTVSQREEIQSAVERGAVETGARLLLASVVPDWFDALALRGGDIELVVDAEAAAVPWEVTACDGRTKWPSFVRRLTVDVAPKSVCVDAKALVIADSYVGEPSGWALGGARAEGYAVVRLLERAGVQCQSIIGKTPADAVERLSDLVRGGVRILHIAAHGTFIVHDGRFGAVQLGSTRTLDRAFWQRLSVVPEVVVLNCCSSGMISPDAQQGVVSLAEAAIGSGVRAFVAAAWPVGDAAAAAFGETLHRELLDGAPFATAVRLARAAARRIEPQGSTWAAFQCYGDPNFRMSARRSNGGANFVASSEALDVLLTLLGDLRAQRKAQRKALGVELATIEARMDTSALKSVWRGDVLYNYAMAWLELGELDRAIEIFDRAVKREDVETRAHFWSAEARSRRVFDRWTSGEVEAISGCGELEAIAKGLEQLTRAGLNAPGFITTQASVWLRAAAVIATTDPPRATHALANAIARLDGLCSESTAGWLNERVQNELWVLRWLRNDGSHGARVAASAACSEGASRVLLVLRALCEKLENGTSGEALANAVKQEFESALGDQASTNWAQYCEQFVRAVAALSVLHHPELSEELREIAAAMKTASK